MNINKSFYLVSLILFGLLLYSCSSTKYVPENEYLLANTKIKSDVKGLSEWELRTHIKQKPNFRTFEVIKVPLSIYNLSGKDSSKWINRTLRSAGEPPVIYDSAMVNATVNNLRRVMTNKGYLNAKIDTIIKLKNKKADVIYNVTGGLPYKINSYQISVPDSVIKKLDSLAYATPKQIARRIDKTGSSLFNMDTVLRAGASIKEGKLFDLDALDKERERLMHRLRRNGYYAINKEHIGFVADTTIGANKVNIQLKVAPFVSISSNKNDTISSRHLQYKVGNIELYIDYNPIETGSIANYVPSSVYEKDGYKIFYGKRGQYIRPSALLDKCFIKPNELYDEEMIKRTYSALAQLGILRNINIHFEEYLEDKQAKLRCVITAVPNNRHSLLTELEGTHSGGFFGIGAGLGYGHKNIFKGSEEFNIKVKGSYEAITSSFGEFNDNYFEMGGEASVTFPRFIFPFLNSDFKKRVQASTQITADYTLQRRPGFFNRTISSTSLKYIWHERENSRYRHAVDLIELSYVSVPQNKLDSTFFQGLSTAAQKYSFSNQFILGSGYTFTRTNRQINQKQTRPTYSIRASIESAGNLLYAAALIANIPKKEDGTREVFDTQFAQYVRANADYSKTYYMDERNSLAWHLGGGIAYPYGNFELVPIQKRFFSGGSNAVRGWSVQHLGPGSYYPEKPEDNNFYNHSGDIRFEANIEYRSRLFWIIELGAFIDAGNIWTARKYEKQERGDFKFNRFYKEIALAWGLGLRFDFDFVLVRLDCGWKAYDPSNEPGKIKWPIRQPFHMAKNTAWHIAVGYPF